MQAAKNRSNPYAGVFANGLGLPLTSKSTKEMPAMLDQISAEESRRLSRSRAWKNWVILGLLVAFVATVYVLSFSHIRTETNKPKSSSLYSISRIG